MSGISNKMIKEYLVASENLLRNATRKVLSEVEEEAFDEAIEIGIINTVAALYDSNVNDNEIVRVLTKCWGMDKEEAESRLIFEKTQAPIRELRYYMKLKGFSNDEIEDFLKSNMVSIKVRHNNELWELRKKPEKLMKIVQKNNIANSDKIS